jgi:hypothetical protein
MSTSQRGRYCRCGARLARDNPDPLCAPCQKQARSAAVSAPVVPAGFWETEQIRDALAAWHFGRLLHAYRLHPFHGQRPLAQETVASWLGLTQAQLSRIETGPPIRDLDKLIRWAEALHVPAHLLWYDLPGQRRKVASPALVPPVALAPSHGGYLSPASLGASPGGASDLATMQAFRAADRQVGGGHMYATVMHYLQHEVGPRLFGGVNREAGTSVFCAAAALTEMAGWMAHDAGRDELAEQHFVRALNLVKVGGDSELSAHILASLSHLAHHLNKPADAIQLAQRGQTKARQGLRNPALEGRLYAMEARGLAALGRAADCARVLGTAARTLTVGPSGEPSAWVSPFDEASHASEAARCMRQLGRLREAEQYASRVVALRPGRTRSHAFGQIILAGVLTEQGRLDETCALGSDVLGETEALSSAQVMQQLEDLRDLLEPHRSVREVAAFLAQLTDTLRERRWLYRWSTGRTNGKGLDEAPS